MAVYSVFVEKKTPFAVEAKTMFKNLKEAINIPTVDGLRIIYGYYVENISSDDLQATIGTVFSSPQVDQAFMSLPNLNGTKPFAVKSLPLQFDQRADSCAQALSFALGTERPLVRCTTVYALEGNVSDEDFLKIKKYVINPVENEEVPVAYNVATLKRSFTTPDNVPRFEGFINKSAAELEKFQNDMSLAMDLADLMFCQEYFRDTEKRDPSETEIKMIDTYWSDHCRHTTFFTQLDELEILDPEIKEASEQYYALRDKLYTTKKRPVTLMDLATIGAKALKADGILNNLDESEEINACSVKITVDVDGKDETWLLMFKNETHNHPTEIEPFGGASTCLGGAIRDPLSGRSYVYQAMRITGAGNPLEPNDKTLEGKLSQRYLVQTAAKGYSSYGNQIGAATGHLDEIYHPGYVAKRMELGAVIAAAPASSVVRETPVAGDKVILLGGKTGKDGLGGATGSSKSLTTESNEESGAEVQKGDAPEERKIVRLFRNPAATKLIKRCNDFGAGGVSVSIGELADGININLDTVPTKLEGMNGTEIAISESQERMSLVISNKDVAKFMELAEAENLDATVVAEITELPRLVMHWQGDTIVDLSRDFLNSNGVTKHTKASIPVVKPWVEVFGDTADSEEIEALLGSLEHCSRKGVANRFDTSAGGNAVLLPFGGKYQLTPTQSMVAKIPMINSETNTASVMGWGFNPIVSTHSPYHGAMLAVIDSVAKMVAAGGKRKTSWLTFQEYFERLGNDPSRWGKPAAALLGGLTAQLELEIGSVGGKDSMSGSFDGLDVPPTLVSFAVSVAKADKVVSGEFKNAGSNVYLIAPEYNNSPAPTFDSLRTNLDLVEKLIEEEKITAIYTLGTGGTAKAIPLMSFGNHIGFRADKDLTAKQMFGAFIVEAKGDIPELSNKLGTTTKDYTLALLNETIDLAKLEAKWSNTLEPIFPLNSDEQGTDDLETFSYDGKETICAKNKVATPKVLIPVFPGASGEYEMEYGFVKEGAVVETLIIKNRSANDILSSVDEFVDALKNSNILAIPSGLVGGDQPDGGGKYIAAFLTQEKAKKAVEDFLANEGLICGIGSGFQALVQVGLLPFGEYRTPEPNSPMITFNSLGAHSAQLVWTRVSSDLSPWTGSYEIGDIHCLPISTCEGRFIAPESLTSKLARQGQIASQYVNLEGVPTEDIRYNPANSEHAIEAITSPDGRIFGRMALSERYGKNIHKNATGNLEMNIFKGAVNYYK